MRFMQMDVIEWRVSERQKQGLMGVWGGKEIDMLPSSSVVQYSTNVLQ